MLRLWIVALCIGILTSLSMGYIVVPENKEMKICAYIDYHGALKIEDDGLYWIDLRPGGAHPGFHDEFLPLDYDENGPTWVNGIPWTPEWFGDGGDHRGIGWSSELHGDFSWVTGIRLGTEDDLDGVFDNYIFYVGSPDNITNYAETPSPVNAHLFLYNDTDGDVIFSDIGVGAHRYVFYLIPEPVTLLTICIGIIAIGCAHGDRFSRNKK